MLSNPMPQAGPPRFLSITIAQLAAGLAICGAALALPAGAADRPEWRGPQRNGVSAETDWPCQWPASGSQQLWTATLGEGFSSVSVVGGRLYTMGNTNQRDTVFCFDANTGKVLWKRTYPSANRDAGYGGCRATPTVNGKRVYTLGTWGQAFCLAVTPPK